jgi:hypothetical protein
MNGPKRMVQVSLPFIWQGYTEFQFMCLGFSLLEEARACLS